MTEAKLSQHAVVVEESIPTLHNALLSQSGLYLVENLPFEV